MRQHHFIQLLLLSTVFQVISSLNNGLGLVPPMGWNSWNCFHCDIDEAKVKAAADELADLQELGYTYLNLDDCWMSHERNSEGKYIGDLERFPSGMKALGDYLHNRGFKFGIYTSAGTKTCAGFPGSLGYEEMDAQTFADWGVDYLKYDNCYDEGIPGVDRYSIMRDALNATGRPIFYSLCQWGREESWQWAPAVGNSWRTTDDIEPNWKSIRANFWQSQQHATRSGPGAWLDPDMLEVGNGLTDAENRAHFSLWCLVKSPLLLGMDLTKMTPAIKAVVSNMNLIRIHQDPHARQATCFHGCSEKADWSILATAVTGGDTIVCIVNWSDTPKSIQHFAAHTVGVVLGPNQVLAVRDLWTNEQLKDKFDYQTAKKIPVPTLEPHDCVIYQLSTKDICKDSVVDPACVE